MYGSTDVRRSRALASCVVFVVVVLLYVNILAGNDREALENNADVSTTNPFAVVFNSDIWGTPHVDANPHAPMLNQKTLVSLSFELDAVLWANEARFQPTNVLLHATASVLVLWLCVWMGLDTSVGTMCALLFATHPVHTEAVATIPGRAELLSAVLYLLALLAYQKSFHLVAAKHSLPCRPTAVPWEWLGTSAIFAYLATLCSPRALSVVGVCLVYDAALVCSIDDVVIRAGWRRLRNKVHTLHDCWTLCSHLPEWMLALAKRAGFMVVSALLILFLRALIAVPASSVVPETDNLASSSLLTSILTHSYLLACNVWLLLCPASLCFDWSMASVPQVTSLLDARNLAAMVLVGAAALLLLEATLGVFGRPCAQRSSAETQPRLPHVLLPPHGTGHEDCGRISGKDGAIPNPGDDPVGYQGGAAARGLNLKLSSRRRFAALSLVLLLLPFLPSSNLVHPSPSVISEKALYLPSMGSCLLVAVGLSSCSGWTCQLPVSAPKGGMGDIRPPRGPSMGRMEKAAVSRRHVDVLKWHFGLKPHVVGVMYLLLLLYSTKTLMRNYEWSNTQQLVEAALRVNPQNAKVLVAMGNILAQQGNHMCEKFYRQALFLNPSYLIAWCNLGIVQLNTGQILEAEGSFLRALALDPNHVGANTNMAHLCRLQERWPEAKEHYRKALFRRPKDGELHYNMGFVSEKLGTPSDLKEAEKHFRLSVQCQPDRQDAHVALANVLSSSVIDNSDGSLPRRRHIEEAFAHYWIALKLNPEDLETHFALGKLLLASDALEEAKAEFLLVAKLSPTLAPVAHLQLNLLHSQLEEQAPPTIHLHSRVVSSDHSLKET